MNVYIPPYMVPDTEKPLIFLAGPIVGAADWQTTAVFNINGMDRNIRIANPRRPENFEEVDKQKFIEQVEWETVHLNAAAKSGCIMFWLEPQSHFTNDTHKRSYAQTTRFELGEWYAKMTTGIGLTGVVVGASPEFPGVKYIARRLAQNGIEVYSSLFAACEAAVKTANRTHTFLKQGGFGI